MIIYKTKKCSRYLVNSEIISCNERRLGRIRSKKMNGTLSKKNFMPTFYGNQFSSPKSLEGESIIVSVAEAPPYLSIFRNSNGEISAIEGYLADLWHTLEEQLKFRTILVDSGPDYLGVNQNGIWNGMIGDLQHKKADVGLANFGITLERKQVVDFSASVGFDSSKLLLFSNIDVENIDWMTYTKVVSWSAYGFIGIIWIVASVSLAYASRKESKNSYCDYIFFLFGAITLQGCEMVPHGFQGRLIFISFWAMCVMLNASFTALLTTHLTTATSKPFSSLGEALNAGFKVSVLRGTLQHQAIIGSPANEDFERVAEMLKEDQNLIVPSVDEGIQSTYDRKTLFLDDLSYLHYETSGNCSFSIQPPAFFTGYFHLGYRKDFQFQEILDHRIIQLMSSGVMSKLVSKWLYSHEECEYTRDETPSLGLGKTLSAFMIVSSGAVISLFIFLGEVITNRLQKSNKENNQNVIRELRLKKFEEIFGVNTRKY